MNREELKAIIEDAMNEVWLKYEEAEGVDYGSVHFGIEMELDDIYEKIADMMILNKELMWEV